MGLMNGKREWHRGTCAICGAGVAVKVAFLSAAYFTCNMAVAGDHTGTAHSGYELRRFYETGERSREPYVGTPMSKVQNEWRRDG